MTNENKSSVANALSNHPLLSLFRLHASSSSSSTRTATGSCWCTREVKRGGYLGYKARTDDRELPQFLHLLLPLHSILALAYIPAESKRQDESPIRDATVCQVNLTLNWISSRSINDRMRTNFAMQPVSQILRKCTPDRDRVHWRSIRFSIGRLLRKILLPPLMRHWTNIF